MSARNRLAAEYLREQLEMDGMKSSALSHIFEDEPPTLDRFLYDQQYLNHLRPTKPHLDTTGYEFTLSPIQYDFLRNMEQIFKPDLYIAMVEEFGPEWSPLPMKNLMALSWGKGSKDPDEPVYDARTGQWVKLRDFKAGPVAAVEDLATGKVIKSYGTDSFKEGEGRMFTITTDSGRKMRVWEGHRFLTWSKEHHPEWKRLWDMQVGDPIAISNTLPEPENLYTPEDREVEWAGLMTGDSCTAYIKHIPKEFFSLSNRQTALLISRLIDTGGWLTISDTVEVGYGTASEQLADDYMNLLLRLGVIGSKTEKAVLYEGESRPYYQVRVREHSRARKLLEQLTLLDKEPVRLAALEWLEGKVESETSFGDVEWDRIASIEYDGWGEYWTLSVDGPANYISNGGVVDHNSGKDSTVRLGIARNASLLGHMKSPQTYFNMASFDEIHFLNVAVSAPQARLAFFDPMKKLFKTNEYLSNLFYGDDPAEGSNTIRLKNNIRIISGHSMAESQEGLNILSGVADEISAFKVAEEFKDKGDGRSAKGAEQIVEFLRSSASSRFPETYKVVQISWPRFHGDAIEKAVAQGNESIKELGPKSPWYVSGPYATWEVKPGLTKEDFAAHFKENPERASAMYAAKPPRTKNAFIRDERAIDNVFNEVREEEPVQVEYYWGYPPKGTVLESDTLKPLEGWQVRFHYADDFRPVEGALYCLHGDMAVVGDRAGVAMSHVRTWEQGTAEEEERPVVKNDFVFAFESDLTDEEHPREVQIRWYQQLIWELVDLGFPVVTATFDGWQSLALRQNLEQVGIDAGLLSLDRNDKVYQTFKDTVMDDRVESYRVKDLTDADGGEPLVVRELKRLRRVGKKIDHLPGQSKDLSDALAGSVWNAISVGGSEDEGALDVPTEDEAFTSSMIMYHNRGKSSASRDILAPNPWGVDPRGLLSDRGPTFF